MSPEPGVTRAAAEALSALRGDDPDFGAQLDGHVVVIDFFATWCEPCRESIAPMKELRRSYGDRGLVVVAVSIDEDTDLVDAYASEAEITYPIYLDPEQGFSGTLGVVQVPALVVLGRDGRVKGRFAQAGAELIERVEGELAASSESEGVQPL